MTIVVWLLSTDGFAAWDQVGDKCPENQGTKFFSGRSNKTFSINFVFQVVQTYRNTVLPWLTYEGTLLKEFEKNKIGNIRLRAVPVEDWVACMID